MYVYMTVKSILDIPDIAPIGAFPKKEDDFIVGFFAGQHYFVINMVFPTEHESEAADMVHWLNGGDQ